jgi:aldehyde:ferredoxin oxidoreductase
VYIWINNGNVEIRKASHLWGLEANTAQEAIRAELGDPKIRVALIGPGGENLVRFACIVNENRHFNGRCGMGAVMGSKNLKAIAVRGDLHMDVYDKAALHEIARKAKSLIDENSQTQLLSMLGTNGWMIPINEEGALPTRNFTRGTFTGAANLSNEKSRGLGLYKKSSTCFACVLRCKQVVEADEPYQIDARYGGPEYESAAALGAYLEVGDPYLVAKANELCSRYTLDTISTGATIAFAMECYEHGLITREQTDGLELKFGNSEVVLQLIEKIARREGIGNLLAEGSLRAAAILGPEASQYAMQVKGVEFPAHLPQGKQSLALAFATVPIGADHGSSEHDYLIAPSRPDFFEERARSLGLNEVVEPEILNHEKVRFYAVTQCYYSLLDTLDLCSYCFGLSYLYSPNDLVRFVRSVTGWDVDLKELMRVGERRINLMRVFNAREGFGRADDTLPERFFVPLQGSGPNAGRSIDRQDFERALDEYYQLMGWDPKSGNPTCARLEELGLGWAIDQTNCRQEWPDL